MRRSLFNARAGAVLTIAAAIVGAHGADAQTRTSPRYEADVTWPKPLPNRWVMPATTLLLAEGHLHRRLFGDMLRRIWALPVPAS